MISDKLKKYKLAYNKFLKECKNSKSKKCKKLSKSLKRSRKSLKRSVKRRRSKRLRRRSMKHDGKWELIYPIQSTTVNGTTYAGGQARITCDSPFNPENLNDQTCNFR